MRVRGCWDESILPALVQGLNVLVVAHANSIRALLMAIDDITEDDIPAVANGLPLVYEFDHGSRQFLCREMPVSRLPA